MHSSRMCTAGLLPVSPSIHCTGEVSALGRCLLWGVSAPGEGVCSWGGCLLPAGGDDCSQGVRVSALGGVCSEGGAVSWYALRQTPPTPVNRMTDRQVQKKHNLRKLHLQAVNIAMDIDLLEVIKEKL